MSKIILSLLTVLALAVGSAAQAIPVLIAKNDGTVRFGSSDFNNGLNTMADSNFVAADLSTYDIYGANVVIKVTMGSVEDYFRPITGATLLEMLTSHEKHEWAPDLTGTYVTPSRFSSGSLGGSGFNWPKANVPGDDRAYLPFWGLDGFSTATGGCCHATLSDGASWSQTFTMEIVAAVPLPAGAWLMLGGLGAAAALRRRSKALG